MNVRVCLRIMLMAVVLAAVSPVCADQWYEHYARAEKALIGRRSRRPPSPSSTWPSNVVGTRELRVRTYGMRVTDYFPYLKLGIAYFAAGEYEAALRAFDTEEQLGAIQDSESAAD